MTFLWFEPKRVQMWIVAVSSDRLDVAYKIGGLRMDSDYSLDHPLSDGEYFLGGEYRFMERVVHCVYCNSRWLLDNAYELLPHHRWDRPSTAEELLARSYPPFFIADKCERCVSKEAQLLRERQEEAENKARVEAYKQAIREEFRQATNDEIAGKLFRCVVCGELKWQAHVMRRYYKWNCCSKSCASALTEHLTNERKRLTIHNLEDNYVATLLGGLKIPSLIEAKRLNIKLKRALQAQKENHDKQN